MMSTVASSVVGRLGAASAFSARASSARRVAAAIVWDCGVKPKLRLVLADARPRALDDEPQVVAVDEQLLPVGDAHGAGLVADEGRDGEPVPVERYRLAAAQVEDRAARHAVVVVARELGQRAQLGARAHHRFLSVDLRLVHGLLVSIQ